MKKLLLIALALIALVIVVAYKVPARLVTPLLEKTGAPISLNEVSGTLWEGRAEHLLYQGSDRGVFSWRISPMRLLLARPEAILTLEDEAFSGKARLTKRGERLYITEASATLPASRLEPILDIPALRLGGEVQIILDELVMQGRVPMALQGRAVWTNAIVSGEELAELGTLSATFGPLPTGGLGGTLQDEGGPLALEGQFKSNLLSYNAQATLRARDGDPQVQRVLRYIGQPQPDGSVLFEVKGGLGR